MEQNNLSSGGSTSPQAGGTSAGAGFGSTSNIGTGSTLGSQGFVDRARDVAGTAQEKLADVGSTARDRAGNLKASLANALDSGAERLRHRGGSVGQISTATEGPSVALETSSRVAPVTARVASGMEATAGWLRETDLDSVKGGIERQVKEHPGRTLLVAVGLGYLIGKAVRK